MNDIHEILLVRHPETEANVDGRYVGRGDAPYTLAGHAQAERLVREIHAWEPESIWSSPLPRTLTVAESAALLCDLEVRVDERLTELDFGKAEGLTYEETRERGIEFNFKSVDAPVAPDGESRSDILLRTSDALTDIRMESNRTVVVTHGGVFRSAMVHLLDLPIEDIWTFHIRNAQLAEIRIVEGHAMLERFVQA